MTDKPAQPQPGTEAYKTLLKQSVEGHWAQEEISALIDAGIVEGDNGVLHLEQTVTRAEFTAMVARAVGLTAAEYQGGFADIDGGAWYAGIVQAAFDKGVIQGDGASFRPDDPITREEMAVIAAKLAQTSGVSGNDTGGAFADEDQISGWSREYVKEAAELGLIQGFEDGSFQPGGDALREQAMVIVYRLRGILPETE